VGLSKIACLRSRAQGTIAESYASRPLVSGRCCRQVAPGLGPPRPAQHVLGRWLVTAVASLVQTVYRESFSRPLTQMGWRSGFPTGRPWDFARDRSLCDRPRLRKVDPFDRDLPDPVPRIASPSPHLQCSSGPLGPTLRASRNSLPRGDSGRASALLAECDFVSLASLAATLTRPATGSSRAH
jgi:hypothetical protein